MSKVEEFLREYEKLCQKYKMGLCGCGCCNSPSLDSNEENVDEFHDINYNTTLNKVFINGDGFWHKRALEGDIDKWQLEKEKTIDEFFESKKLISDRIKKIRNTLKEG